MMPNSPSSSTIAAVIDLDRLAKLLGIAGSSVHEGEVVNAVRLCDRLLNAAGMRWPDLVKPFEQAAVATEAARVLVAENNELRAENERLRAEASRGTAVAIWENIGDGHFSNVPVAATWALDLFTRGECWLSTFESDFLLTASQWQGRLTPKQLPVFDQIIAGVVERTGQFPPT
jgi:hypothetical protein